MKTLIATLVATEKCVSVKLDLLEIRTLVVNRKKVHATQVLAGRKQFAILIMMDKHCAHAVKEAPVIHTV